MVIENNGNMVLYLIVIWGVFASVLVFKIISNTYAVFASFLLVLPVFYKIIGLCKSRAIYNMIAVIRKRAKMILIKNKGGINDINTSFNRIVLAPRINWSWFFSDQIWQ